jgi:hypothetical protein
VRKAVYEAWYHSRYTAYQCLALAKKSKVGGRPVKGPQLPSEKAHTYTHTWTQRAHKGAGYTESIFACLVTFLDKRESVARGYADPYPPAGADDPASGALEWGNDSAEGGHLGGLANQDVTQKLDQVFPCTECGSATENSGPRRR